jgi:hypothetical protein
MKGFKSYSDQFSKDPLKVWWAKAFEILIRLIERPLVMQMMFGQDVSVAAQDPSYPVYVDSSVIMGMTGGYNSDTKAFNGLEYMPCRPENDFFPDLAKV